MITDKQWKKLEPLFPKLKRRRDRRGRPWAENRACFEGVLWVLRTGARWRDLPPQFPSGSTCWRRLQDWEEQGALEEIWRTLLSQLDRRGLLRWEETFMDGSFASAKKGAWPWEKPSEARVQSGWFWLMARVFLWEFSWRLHPRTNPRWPKPRSPKSKSRVPGADRGNIRSAS